jgi:hypothetical protein
VVVHRGLVVAVLVVLAGCSGFTATPAAGPTDTLTPVPVPETPSTPAPSQSTTPTATLAAEELVPGVTAERVADPFALVDAHVVGMTAASYAVRRTTTVRHPNGTLRTRETTTARVGAGGERYRLVDEVAGPAAASVQSPPGRFTIWTDGERFLSVFRPDGGPPEYARIAPDRYLTQREYYSPPPDRGSLLALLSAFEVRPVERRPRLATPSSTPSSDGPTTAAGLATGTPSRTPSSTVSPASTASGTPRPVPVRADRSTPTVAEPALVGYRLVGTELVRPPALGSVGPGREARNASLELLVDTRGRIHRYDLSYTALVEGERVSVTQRSRYRIGGVRVERPRWYGAAIAATTNATVRDGSSTATAGNGTATPTPVPPDVTVAPRSLAPTPG